MPLYLFWLCIFALTAPPPPAKRPTHLRLVEKKTYV